MKIKFFCTCLFTMFFSSNTFGCIEIYLESCLRWVGSLDCYERSNCSRSKFENRYTNFFVKENINFLEDLNSAGSTPFFSIDCISGNKNFFTFEIEEEDVCKDKIKIHKERVIYTTGVNGASAILPKPDKLTSKDFKEHHTKRPCRLKGSDTCKSWDFNLMGIGRPITSSQKRDLYRAKIFAPRDFRVLTEKEAMKVNVPAPRLNDLYIQDVKTGAIMQIIHNDEIPPHIRNAIGTGKIFPGGTLIAYQGDYGSAGAYHIDVQSTDPQYIVDLLKANMSGEYNVCNFK